MLVSAAVLLRVYACTRPSAGNKKVTFVGEIKKRKMLKTKGIDINRQTWLRSALLLAHVVTYIAAIQPLLKSADLGSSPTFGIFFKARG